MKKAALIIVVLAMLGATGLLADLLAAQTTALAANGSSASDLKVSIEVTNLDTGQPIEERGAVRAGTPFQVTVTSNGVDCAGQFVVSALGAPGAPPSVLVQVVPFILGPASGGATGSPLVAAALAGTAVNDWKISASCNGATPKSFEHGEFEFFADPGAA